MKISIIGNGKLAQALAYQISLTHHQVYQMVAQDFQKLINFTSKINVQALKSISQIDPQVDLIIISVNDNAIEQVVNSLPKGDFMLAHTSGSVPLSILDHSRFKHTGVFYPMQSFQNEYVTFNQVPVLVESAPLKLVSILEVLAHDLGANPHIISTENRAYYHLSAVFFNNFTNHLWAIGEALLNEKGLDFDLIRPLITKSIEKIVSQNNFSLLQTGPAIRKDLNTIERHQKMLCEFPQWAEIYKLISADIQNFNAQKPS